MARFTILLFIISLQIIFSSCNMGKEENHNLLKSLGLAKVKMPSSHYRKRLAVDARHYSRGDDSHMFVIKLPPMPHYYVHNRPDSNSALMEKKKLSVGFQSNGKPKKIYHWNMPVLKKIALQRSDNRLLKQEKHFNNVDDKYVDSNVFHRKIPTYYVPVKQKKQSFHKYFPGNGKPHSFYVIEKSKKSHLHKLLV